MKNRLEKLELLKTTTVLHARKTKKLDAFVCTVGQLLKNQKRFTAFSNEKLQ